MTERSYNTLADLLSSKLVTNIEIVLEAALLPDVSDNEYQPYVLIDGNLGIPQKALYGAYMTACNSFNAFRRAGDVDALLRSTSVILLVNAAHYTALNARKRLVQRGQRDEADELSWTAMLLREQQASKSSLLWHHRRWLLSRLHGQPVGDTTARAVSDSVLPRLLAEQGDREVAMSAQACEQYPRNYFAWHHRQLSIRALSSTESETDSKMLLARELDAVQVWITQHVADHSAVHHAAEVLNLLQRHGGDEIAARKALDHAISLLEAVPNHESLWLLLRRLLLIVPPAVQVDFADRIAQLSIRDGSPKLHVDFTQEKISSLSPAWRAAYWRANIASVHE
ncbi:hypothetical protein BKA62DRAFT_697237 [Auriculariales sp. MPI-PUGE-AT-0066]|nr:hypothetical protein BKA62DRAFT_697237 [Auriculariales sp. MPI-PUGE-AT-0066]